MLDFNDFFFVQAVDRGGPAEHYEFHQFPMEGNLP